MGALSNRKHELFAQELAKGATAEAAYVEAGYRADRGHASRLAANGNVQARVAELIERAAARTEITVATVTERLLKIAEKGEGAEDAPMLSVARAALMDAAKLNGLVVDRSKVEATVRSHEDALDELDG